MSEKVWAFWARHPGAGARGPLSARCVDLGWGVSMGRVIAEGVL